MSDLNLKEKAISSFREIINKCKKTQINLDKIHMNINESDSYAEKTFFAFLNDLLRINKPADFKDELLKHLRENESLTNEKLQIILLEELKKYSFTDENLKKENLENNIKNKELLNLTTYIINEKFEKLKSKIDDIENKDSDEFYKVLKNNSEILTIKQNDIVNYYAETEKYIKENKNEIKKEENSKEENIHKMRQTK
ncbi:hypothetical protein [Campylobacter coli]|uniref:hypothetical protein n=1 Tax=Campylobacter coli TaxID=195 RepID=UPI00366F9ECD